MADLEQMSQAVDRFLSSGKSRLEFCEETGIKPGTFSYWLKRVREQKDISGGGFSRILVNDQASHAGEVEIIYPNAVRIKASSDQLSLISRLIRLY